MRLVNYNLVLGAIWLVVGLGLLSRDWVKPEQRLTIPGTAGLNAGWFALVLAAYNGARWHMNRSRQREREMISRLEENVRLAREQPPKPGPVTPNVELDFFREPPEKDKRSTE